LTLWLNCHYFDLMILPESPRPSQKQGILRRCISRWFEARPAGDRGRARGRDARPDATGESGSHRRGGRFGALLAGVAVVCAATAGCGGTDSASENASETTAASGSKLVVYSGRNEELVGPLYERFEAATGIDLEVRYGDSDELALAIDQEGDRGQVDVFVSQSPGAVGYLTSKDRLTPIDQPVLDRVAPEDRSNSGNWVGLSGRARVQTYNTTEVDAADLPGSVFDLTDPQWKGRVALAPGNGSFIDFVSGMRQIVGDDRTKEWLAGMAANEPPTYPGNSPILEAVNRGEVASGLVNHYYREIAAQEDPNLAAENHFFAPGDPGSILLVTAGGIPSTASNRSGANELLAFLLSEESQRFVADEKFEYPLAIGMAAPGSLPPLTDLPVTRLDLERLGDSLTSTIDMIRASGLQQ